MASIFPCSKCGLCCQKVDLSTATRFLDRGDGTCRHYNSENRTCDIYEQRPDVCSVPKQYQKIYSSKYTWDEFVELNLTVCNYLQEAHSLQVSK